MYKAKHKSKHKLKHKSKLRIAMLGHKHIPSEEGGIELVVEELSTRMVKTGHSVTCYNRKGQDAAVAETVEEKNEVVVKTAKGKPKEYKGVRLIRVFTVNKRGLAAMTASMAASIRAAFGSYDVVHIHAEGPAFMCRIPKLLGKRVIVTVHGLDHQRAKWGRLASAYIMLGERNAVRFADEIIVLSKGIQEYFKKHYGRETRFIPNGVNVVKKKDSKLITDKWGLVKDSYILYLGRIVPEKGISYLIEAFKQVKTDKRLVIAGGSSDTDKFLAEITNMAKDDERIVFTGFVRGQTKCELYSNAYLYTLPSDLEGMPLSLLEAMSYGNCCLTSDISECAEVVEDKAVLFKKGNVCDLTDKLQMLCDTSELVQKYKESAAAFILSKYNWDKVVTETLELYQQRRI